MSTPPDAVILQAPDMDLLHTLFSFKGRLRRQHFLIGMLFHVFLTVIGQFDPLLGLIVFIPNNWIFLALISKRLHDMEYSGFFAAIPLIFGPLLLTIIFILIAAGGSGGFLLFLLPLATGATYLGFFVWLAFSEGMSGANQYGPDPKLPAPCHPAY